MGNRLHKHLFGLSGSANVGANVTKYGLDQFAFILLDTVGEIVTTENNQVLLDLEDFHLDTIKPTYNILRRAHNSFGYTHTAETITRLKSNYSSARRDTIGALNRGQKLSPTTIQRITAAALARPPMSEKTRQLVSANSAKAQLYKITLLDGSMPEIILRTIPTVANYVGCREKTVRIALQGNGVIKRK